MNQMKKKQRERVLDWRNGGNQRAYKHIERKQLTLYFF
jgi:hypothetical protein